MSDKKQTFIDPKTGEEIEATLAIAKIDQTIFEIVLFVLWEIPMGGIGGISLGLLGLCFGADYFLQGTIAGLCIGCFLSPEVILASRRQIFNPARELLFLGSVARWQNIRRQRLLQRKLAEEEWANVPDRALSQAQPPSEPQVTDVSLSQANPPEEEKPRLTEAVEEKNSDRPPLWRRIGLL